MDKFQIRKKILETRKEKYAKDLLIEPNKILKILEKIKINNITIGGYYPYNYEIDTTEILKKLQKRNYKISLPKICKKNQMNFFEWSFEDPLSINIYGIPEPISKTLVYPDILLVPLVAFDNELNRLGYGGGYYDRYLGKNLNFKKIIKIGLGYSFQEIHKIPINQYDMKLDYIITEKNLFR